MGIPGLPALIQSKAGNYAVKEYDLTRFAGMTVAIDASLTVHQTVIAMRSSGRDLTNLKGQLTSHLYGIFYKILRFLEHGIVPIFVFDGKAPDIKNFTLRKRTEKKEHAKKLLESLTDSDDEEYIKNFKQTFSPSKKDYKELRIMLDLMGIPYLEAPGEADVAMAWLASKCNPDTEKPYVSGVCSNDSDLLAFGTPFLFKDMLCFMAKDKKVKVINLKRSLVRMELTMDQFIDLCVLIGCDYCKHLKGIGKKSAYNLIKKHGSLREVLKYLKKNRVLSVDEEGSEDNQIEETAECMLKAAHYFRTAVQDLDNDNSFVLTDDNLKLRQLQYDELMDFMCVKHGFDVERIKTGVDRLKGYYERMAITRPNTKKVHKILQPRSENYTFLDDDIAFLPSDDERNEETEPIASKDRVDETKVIGGSTNKPVNRLRINKGGWRTPVKKLVNPGKKVIDLTNSQPNAADRHFSSSSDPDC